MAKAKPKAKKAPAAAAVKFEKGDRVKVLAGDWGNARGTVQGPGKSGAVSVKLDQFAHDDSVHSFAAGELVPATGTGDRL